ncbi:energy-coupling factor transport system ATP-binding protein [Hathewaya proteolytica DSM 3090]|uniref:Energy-coupling factor transport system ATP-binding protein n=1 Tax=Hathewaya proteolytica DSM 3090 TaxID=1121331 RepID=A0A1M6STW3_9CLOT|nr:energy-coupling factor transporter ATPase [Hathewaya proteolytica]SHK48125.1 energy-coupling factor transport system ATP-binding protein [Hathewaya proteolytica DSM 3090]
MEAKKLVIECSDVEFAYEDEDGSKLKVLNGIDLEVNSGDFVAILGHNGSGKSTLAKLLNGILEPQEGQISVYGYNPRNENEIWKLREKVGMVFQNPDNQIVATIVEEDVAFGPENLGVEPAEIRKRVDESLKIVDMYQYRTHSPSLLSGGQKQRVAIAGILAMDTNCIIFDESTAMLDPKGRKEVIETADILNKEYGKTIILITHYMEEVVKANKVIVLNNGNIVLKGTPKEVFSNVDTLKKLGLDVPQVTDLANELKKAGLEINDGIITIDEMVKELCLLRSEI